MKVEINNKVVTLTDFCKFSIIDNKLFNNNTNRFEAVDGDIVEFKYHGEIIRDEVVGYTVYQVIPTKNHGTIVLPIDTEYFDPYIGTAKTIDIKIEHRTKVYYV